METGKSVKTVLSARSNRKMLLKSPSPDHKFLVKICYWTLVLFNESALELPSFGINHDEMEFFNKQTLQLCVKVIFIP